MLIDSVAVHITISTNNITIFNIPIHLLKGTLFMTKMLHMKYNGIIYSGQVPEKLETHENASFFTYNPLENILQKILILMHFVAPIPIQLNFIFNIT